jgi:hypothetical protein
MTTLLELFFGRNIQQSHTEALQPISLANLAKMMQTGADGLDELCHQLKTILKMDKAAYGKHKLRLPFFCCATFEGNIRHSKNFKYIDCCVLDFDKAPSKAFVQETILPLLKSDERIALAFTSPSAKGAKAIMMLNSPVTDLQAFSQGYKNLVSSFAKQYGLEEYADLTTSDATRVCFLAHDPALFINPNPVPVIWQQYLPQSSIFTGMKEMVKNENVKNEDITIPDDKQKDNETQNEAKAKLNPDTYAQVVRRLNPTAVIRSPKEVVVPEILEQVAVQVQAALAAAGLQLKELKNIQYGKKIAAARGFAWAEVNVFYGKKGFSIVRSPKTGTDAALGEELEALVWQTLQQPTEVNYGVNPDS